MGKLASVKNLWILVAAGAAALYGASYLPNGNAEATKPEPVHRSQKTERATERAVASDTKQDREIDSTLRAKVNLVPTNNLFTSTNWLPAPPPPPPPKIVEPPPPQAPPVPFSFVGLLEDRVKPTAFLAQGDALLIVSAGDTVAGTYRVDAISAQEIALTYLPLHQRQIIRIPGG